MAKEIEEMNSAVMLMVCVVGFIIVFIMPAFALGALAKYALAPMLAQVGVEYGDNWYLGIVGGISLALLMGWSFAVTALMRDPDRDGRDEGEKQKGSRWRESRYGLHHELAGTRRRRRRRYRRG